MILRLFPFITVIRISHLLIALPGQLSHLPLLQNKEAVVEYEHCRKPCDQGETDILSHLRINDIRVLFVARMIIFLINLIRSSICISDWSLEVFLVDHGLE